MTVFQGRSGIAGQSGLAQVTVGNKIAKNHASPPGKNPDQNTMNTLRHTHFPYCLQQRGDKMWVILNRYYRPLGFDDSEPADYESIPAAVCIASITPSQAKKLSYDSSDSNTGSIYLYNDGHLPEDSPAKMQAYLDQLRALMKIERNE